MNKYLDKDESLLELNVSQLKEMMLASVDGEGLAVKINNPRILADVEDGYFLLDAREGNSENDLNCDWQVDKIIMKRIERDK